MHEPQTERYSFYKEIQPTQENMPPLSEEEVASVVMCQGRGILKETFWLRNDNTRELYIVDTTAFLATIPEEVKAAIRQKERTDATYDYIDDDRKKGSAWVKFSNNLYVIKECHKS